MNTGIISTKKSTIPAEPDTVTTGEGTITAGNRHHSQGYRYAICTNPPEPDTLPGNLSSLVLTLRGRNGGMGRNGGWGGMGGWGGIGRWGGGRKLNTQPGIYHVWSILRAAINIYMRYISLRST